IVSRARCSAQRQRSGAPQMRDPVPLLWRETGVPGLQRTIRSAHVALRPGQGSAIIYLTKDALQHMLLSSGGKTMSKLDNRIFHDEDKAREALEAVRWPDGPYCPHCGNADPERIAKVEGKKQTHRPGLYYCNECQG